MWNFKGVTQDEGGFVLVLSLMILLILTLLGLAANNTTTTEILISGNESLQKRTFYRADGATEMASSVVEENVACITGFTPNSGVNTVMDGVIQVNKDSLNLWQNVAPTAIPTDAVQDLFFPVGYAPGEPHTNVNVGGQTKMTTGSSLQMAAGYEGKGKGIGAGGAHLLYDIFAQQVDVNNASALIHVQWRHTVGQEGDCYY